MNSGSVHLDVNADGLSKELMEVVSGEETRTSGPSEEGRTVKKSKLLGFLVSVFRV